MRDSPSMQDLAKRARGASRACARLDAEDRRRILESMAEAIEGASASIVSANATDMEAGRSSGLSNAMLDRLMLNDGRVRGMAQGLRDVAALPDALGEELERIERPNGLVISKVRAPMGVVLMIYESRPNVTADAAGICLKAGSAVILKGGSEAFHSNSAIAEAMIEGGRSAGLPEHAIQLLRTTERADVHELLQMDNQIDLVIPRGGEGLIRAIAEHSRVPVLKHYKGVCHVFVDETADVDMAQEICVNAKCQRPGVCNAMETLLVHQACAEKFLPQIGRAFGEHGVEVRCDPDALSILGAGVPATEDDWREEYLDLICAIRVVSSLDDAIEHINFFGSGHTDAIVTSDKQNAERFLREVDSATVYHNASTRFTDGAEFGKGAEIGISTDKLHARGPCGVEEITTYKYVARGQGQVRT